MYWLRGCYYKLIKKLSDVEQIEQFTGFGLYDAEFIQVLRDLDDPTPFLRGIVAELGFRRKEIPYEQPLRRAGKTSNNFYRLYDAAMLSITSYTKVGLRLATIFGSICAAVSMIVAVIYLVMKLIYWDRFPAGMAPLLIGMCFLGSVQIFFIGMVGEYVLSINQRVMKRPLVVEEERINFSTSSAKGHKGPNGKKNGQGQGEKKQPGREPLTGQKQRTGQKPEGKREQEQKPGSDIGAGHDQNQTDAAVIQPRPGDLEQADSQPHPKRRRRRKKPGSQADGQPQNQA